MKNIWSNKEIVDFIYCKNLQGELADKLRLIFDPVILFSGLYPPSTFWVMTCQKNPSCNDDLYIMDCFCEDENQQHDQFLIVAKTFKTCAKPHQKCFWVWVALDSDSSRFYH